MTKLEYSVVIRTLGNTGDKYQTLLNSIKQQLVQPLEIIVVLPHGYTIDHRLGCERFVYTEKGMVNQRIVGFKSAKTEYILVVDDDVSFEPDFAQNMLSYISKYDADVVLPSEYKIIQHTLLEKIKHFTKSSLLNLKYIIIGLRFLHFNKKYVYKIALTGGNSKLFSINDNKVYLSQSGNFQCFLMKTDAAKNVKLEEEYWLNVNNYANNDDQVFFYKSFLKANKIIFVPKITYSHLNGGVAQANSNLKENLKKKLYGISFNRTVFWYRFLFSKSNKLKKIILIISLLYSLINTTILYLIVCVLIGVDFKITFAVFKASKDAINYINTNKQEILKSF